jgi:photosystem II stability/assembly factor-like uncharacterized protein
MSNHKQFKPLFLNILLILCFSFSYTAQGRQWVNIGPTPIITSNYGTVAGRVAEIAVDPSNSDHWLIGVAFGGIWETRDAGMSWMPRSDDQVTLAMGAIAFVPSNPSTVYAGTGEAVWFAGAGLLKSENGGETWQLLTDKFAKTSFSDIKVDPANPNILLAATTRGRLACPKCFIGNNDAPGAAEIGVFKSFDAGQNWSRQLDGRATDLEIDPRNFNQQYAALGNHYGNEDSNKKRIVRNDNGLYRSTDGGETWELIIGPWTTETGGVGRVELALAPSNPDILYIAIQDADDGVGSDKQLLGIWRTENAQDASPVWEEFTAWKKPITLHSFGRQQTNFDLEIIVDPTDANILYAGGVQIFKLAFGAAQTIKSIDHGIHPDYHAMSWAGNKLIVGNDGGVYSIDRTDIETGSWKNHNANLSITQFYYGSVHPTDPNFIIGGSQDNGTEKRMGTNAWKWITGGDGMDNAISSTRPDTDWATSYQMGNIYKTTNGNSFTYVNIPHPTGEAPEYHTRFEKCPSNDDIFIATSATKIWKAEDFFTPSGPTWLENNSPAIIPPLNGYGATALAFSPSDTSCQTYAVGNNHGQIHLTTDAGNQWSSIHHSPRVLSVMNELTFHPDDSNILYATSDYAGGKVFKTLNALDTTTGWDDITPAGMITAPFSLLVDPSHPDNVYVGTLRGVWHSPDGGETWEHMGHQSGMPNVPVRDLEANEVGNIVAFTHGRGAYTLVTTQDVKYLIGDKDNFHSGDLADTPPQSQVVLDLVASRAPEDNDVALDNGGVNRPVGFTHHFIIPKNAQLISANIEFSFKGSEHVHNDGIMFEKPKDANSVPPVILLKDLLGFEPEKNVAYTATIDLSNVPVRNENFPSPGGHFISGPDEYRNLMELAGNQLDMVFIDDTEVDYSELTLKFAYSSEDVLEGDLNNDNCIDRSDLMLLIAEIRNRTPFNEGNDINGDLRFNIADARFLVTLFSKPRGASCQ